MKTVLITGVNRGIGRALAEKFLKNGDFVIGTVKEGSVDFRNKNIEILPLDLTDSRSIKSCVEKVASIGKRVDIHINNAGVLLDEEETKVVVDKLRATLEVNLIGTIEFTEKMLPYINNLGHIINISSSAGSLARPVEEDHFPYHYPAYKISKAALNMYTRTLSGRLKGEGITVSSVHPGWVKTDMGGQDADIEPAEAAQHIFELANREVETGQFWFEGGKHPW